MNFYLKLLKQIVCLFQNNFTAGTYFLCIVTYCGSLLEEATLLTESNNRESIDNNNNNKKLLAIK